MLSIISKVINAVGIVAIVIVLALLLGWGFNSYKTGVADLNVITGIFNYVYEIFMQHIPTLSFGS